MVEDRIGAATHRRRAATRRGGQTPRSRRPITGAVRPAGRNRDRSSAGLVSRPCRDRAVARTREVAVAERRARRSKVPTVPLAAMGIRSPVVQSTASRADGGRPVGYTCARGPRISTPVRWSPSHGRTTSRRTRGLPPRASGRATTAVMRVGRARIRRAVPAAPAARDVAGGALPSRRAALVSTQAVPHKPPRHHRRAGLPPRPSQLSRRGRSGRPCRFVPRRRARPCSLRLRRNPPRRAKPTLPGRSPPPPRRLPRPRSPFCRKARLCRRTLPLPAVGPRGLAPHLGGKQRQRRLPRNPLA